MPRVWVLAAFVCCACGGATRPESPQRELEPAQCNDSACCVAATPHGCVEWGDNVIDSDPALAGTAYVRGCELRVGEACRKAAEVAWVDYDDARARDLWRQGCELGDSPSCQPQELEPVPGLVHMKDAPPSHAETMVDAYKEGQRAYDLGQFDVAVSAFKRGYELDPKPPLLYNVAQAYRLGGDFDHALLYYQKFLATEPDAKARARAEPYMRDLEDRVRQLRNAPRRRAGRKPVDY